VQRDRGALPAAKQTEGVITMIDVSPKKIHPLSARKATEQFFPSSTALELTSFET